MKRVLLSAACLVAVAVGSAGASTAGEGPADPASIPYTQAEKDAAIAARKKLAAAAQLDQKADSTTAAGRATEGQGGSTSPKPKH